MARGYTDSYPSQITSIVTVLAADQPAAIAVAVALAVVYDALRRPAVIHPRAGPL
jgi:hypothetical protein